MKILILILQYPPDVNSTGQLMAQLADAWVLQGHAVSVITSFPHYEHFRVWPEYRGKFIETLREDSRRQRDLETSAERDGKARRRTGERETERIGQWGMRSAVGSRSTIGVTRVWVHANGRKSMLNRLANYLSFNALAAVAGVMAHESWDVIFCPNGSFFNGLTGWLLGRARIPVVYNVQDRYPDVPIQARQLQNPFAIRVLRGIEKFMYRKAAHVTGISPSIVDAITDKGIARHKTSTIPNFVDTDFFRPLSKVNHVSQRLGLDRKFVVMHAGYLGYTYDLETILHAAMLRREADILFVIVGNGVAKEAMEKAAHELELDNVLFLPFQPHKDLPWLRAAADVQLSLNKARLASYSMPSKIYEIMASGRPLLASSAEDSDVWKLVRETGCGVCIEPGQPEQLAETILNLYRDAPLRDMMGERGREHAVTHYSKESVAHRYLELFRRLTSSEEHVRGF